MALNTKEKLPDPKFTEQKSLWTVRIAAMLHMPDCCNFTYLNQHKCLGLWYQHASERITAQQLQAVQDKAI